MFNSIKVLVASTGGRLLLLPASVTGLVGIVGIAKGLGVDMPGISWWTIAFFALLPLSVWSIAGLVKRVVELDHKLDEVNDVLYCVTTSPLVTVSYKKRAATCDLNLGFNINTSKPIHYEVAEMKGKINNVILPSLTLAASKGGLIIPSEKERWFKLPSAKFPSKPQSWIGDMEYKIIFGPPTNPKKFFMKKQVHIQASPGKCNESIISESRGLNE